jgi:hypothetical protein
MAFFFFQPPFFRRGVWTSKSVSSLERGFDIVFAKVFWELDRSACRRVIIDRPSQGARQSSGGGRAGREPVAAALRC